MTDGKKQPVRRKQRPYKIEFEDLLENNAHYPFRGQSVPRITTQKAITSIVTVVVLIAIIVAVKYFV